MRRQAQAPAVESSTHRRLAFGSAVICIVAIFFSGFASSALAAQTHPYTGTSFGPDGWGAQKALNECSHSPSTPPMATPMSMTAAPARSTGSTPLEHRSTSRPPEPTRSAASAVTEAPPNSRSPSPRRVFRRHRRRHLRRQQWRRDPRLCTERDGTYPRNRTGRGDLRCCHRPRRQLLLGHLLQHDQEVHPFGESARRNRHKRNRHGRTRHLQRRRRRPRQRLRRQLRRLRSLQAGRDHRHDADAG